MAGKNVGLVLSIDSEKQYTQAVQNIKKETNLLKTEMKNLSQEFAGNANSMDALRAKQENLTRQQEAYQRKVSATREGLKNAKKVYNEQSDALEELKKKLEDARKVQEKMEDSGDTTSDAYKKQEKQVKALSDAVEKQTLNTLTASGRVTDWNKRLSESEGELRQCSKALAENEQYLREAETATDNCASSIDSLGQQVKQSQNGLQDLSETVADTSQKLEEGAKSAGIFGDVFSGNLAADAVGKGLDALKDGAEMVKESLYDVSGASADLAARTGATAQQMEAYNDVMLGIRGNNFGEDYRDISDAMAVVIQTMGDLDDVELQGVTENAITLRDTFGMDYQESIRAVKMLMDQFGVSSEQAFNLIVQGAQQGLDKNGDLLDTINEYSVHYAQMGTTADEFFNSLKNGTDAGTFSVDKLGDAYKEFGIRVKDTATSTDEAYELLGLDADEMRRQFAKGGESAKEATETVLDALFNLDDGVKQNQAGVDLFGTMWEDLGVSGVAALTDLEGSISSVGTAMADLKETKYSDLESAISGLGAAVQEKIVGPVKDAALPAITGLLQGITEAIDPPKDKMQELADSAAEAGRQVSAAMAGTDAALSDAADETGKIEVLGEQLLNLNGIEEKSLAQKYRLKSVVAELGEYIPEVAAAYDEEAGKVALADEEITSLIASKKELLATEALEAAGQEMMNALVEAEVKLEQAKMAKENSEEKLALLDKERQLYEDLYESRMALGEDPGDAFDTAQLELWNQALEDGLMTQQEYDEALQSAGAEGWRVRVLQMGDASRELEKDVSSLAEETENLSLEVEKGEEAYDSYTQASEKVINGHKVEAEAAKEAADAAEENSRKTVSASELIADGIKNAAGAAVEFAEKVPEKLEQAAAAAEAGAEIQKMALENVQDKYEEFRSQLEADIQNKISLFDAFDGGEDMTVEQMLSNLQSQREGLEKWKKNMETLAEEVGTSITPEFYNAILEMGPEAANAVQHMVDTLEQGNGRELLQQMCEEWGASMDFSESASESMANTRLAIEAGLREIGSTDADFSELKTAIENAAANAGEGWDTLTDSTREELEKALQTAQAIGAQIPSELAEGIANGEEGALSVLEQLNGSIQGTFDGLAEIARQQGIEVPEELSAGIAAGGDEAVRAYNELISRLLSASGAQQAQENGEEIAQAGANAASGKTPEYESAGADSGEAYASGLQDSKGQAETAAGAVSDSALKRLQDALGEFQRKGTESAARYTAALSAYRIQASAAGDALALAAYNAAASWQNYFYHAGYNMASGMASGIDKGSPLVADAARRAVRNAKDAANDEADSNSPSRVFEKQVGYYMSAGIAKGISDGEKDITDASRDVAKAALGASKKELDINSPSRKFRKDVGEQIGKGFAFGIKDSASLAGKEAKKMSRKVYTNATSWLSRYKKSQKISLADEKYYWEQVKKHLKSGTDAYQKAQQKINTINSSMVGGKASKRIAQNFGVSRTTTTTTGSGKNQKTVTKRKSDKDYYGEIYNAAAQWLENYETLHNLSLDQEEAYWEKVKKKLKEGTQGWYDAQKQLNEIREKQAEKEAEYYQKRIDNVEKKNDTLELRSQQNVSKSVKNAEKELENWQELLAGLDKKKNADEYKEVEKNIVNAYGNIVSAAQQYVDNQKTLNAMSAQQELAYWQDIQDMLDEGTQSWYDVQEKIADAQERIAEKADEKYDKMVEDMEDYISKKKILGEVSEEDELKYWRDILAKIQKQGGKYTDAWYDVKEKITDAKSDVKEAQNAKYDKMVTDAEDYIRKQEILGKMTASKEKKKWESVLKEIEEGGGKYKDAWYDVKETIRDLEEEISEDARQAAEDAAQKAKDALTTTASVQNSILSKYKTYYKVSAKAEMEYWDIARKQFQAGTDERIEADQNYMSALQDWYDQRRELDEEYAENSKKINDKLADSVQELQDAYKDAVASRKQDILSSMSLFEAWDSTGYDADTLLYNLKTQVAGLTLWEQQLEELSKKNVSEDLLEELRAMGPDAAASIYSLNQMTASQLDEYNKLWQQKNALAESQAVKESETLRLETNSEIAKLRTDAQTELNALNADYRAALAELNTGISADLKNLVGQAAKIGEDAVSGLVAGIGKAADSVDTYNSTTQVVSQISGQLSSLPQEGKVIGENTLDGILDGLSDEAKINTAAQKTVNSIKRAMEEAAEIHSPSRLFKRDIGAKIPAGVGEGVEEGTVQAAKSAKGMVQDMLAAAQAEMQGRQAELQLQMTELDFSGIARLNRLTESYKPQAPVVNIDNKTLASLLGTLITAVNGLSEKMDHQQLVMYPDVVAGELRTWMDKLNGETVSLRNRGRY